MKTFYVYILSSGKYGTLYTGVTNDLIRRMDEHRRGLTKGFTQKYRVDQLVYFAETDDINSAIEREKQIKSWRRAWKIRLIEETNPEWRDLSKDFLE
jgi:putative endonuclease